MKIIPEFRVRIPESFVREAKIALNWARHDKYNQFHALAEAYPSLVITDEGWLGFYNERSGTVLFDKDVDLVSHPDITEALARFVAYYGGIGYIRYGTMKRERLIEFGMGSTCAGYVIREYFPGFDGKKQYRLVYEEQITSREQLKDLRQDMQRAGRNLPEHLPIHGERGLDFEGEEFAIQ